jgi:SAM-dependent methyltransferase
LVAEIERRPVPFPPVGNNPHKANRHAQRYRYFFEPLLSLHGGSLEGHRVLDLGCNAGTWTLCAIEAGADFVLGVDGRADNIEKARAKLEGAGISEDRYQFEVGNILELTADPGFDIVLCLGVFYHVSKPVELFEVMRAAQVVVIDTEVSQLPGSAFSVGRESLDENQNAVDSELVFWPTRQAVIDLAHEFGFRCVPLALHMTDEDGMRGYTEDHRVAFICAKEMDLGALSQEASPGVRKRKLLSRR